MVAARRGFSLVELLVVLAVVGVLAGLIVPAVQRGRESASRLECANNLKQIGLAFHHFELVHKIIPPNRVPCGPTWAVFILPYLDQQTLYDAWDFDKPYYEQSTTARETALPVFFCPTRRNPHSAPGLSVVGDERLAGLQVRGALGDYAYNLGPAHAHTDEDVEDVFTVDDRVIVPNLYGRHLKAATKTLEIRGLNIKASGDSDVGVVETQMPPAGAKVERNSTVEAHFVIKVPYLLGQRYGQALARLEKLDLKLKAEGDSLCGVVDEQAPPPDTIVPRHTEVKLLFKIKVPDILVKGYREAKKILAINCLEIEAKGDEETIRKGVVSLQEPTEAVYRQRGDVVQAWFQKISDGNKFAPFINGATGPGPLTEARKLFMLHCASEGGGPSKRFLYDAVETKLSQVTDGLSNTVFVGEKHVPIGLFGRGGWDCSLYNGAGFSCTGRVGGVSFELARSIRDPDWKFGSYHPKLCQFLFGDGSVRPISTTVHSVILGRLVHHSDGRVIPLFD